jgi:hypothetical protein
VRRDPNLYAYPLKDGWKIVGTTYPHRERIVGVGGRWNPDRKCWWVPQEGPVLLRMDKVPILKMVRAIVAANCHNPEEEAWVTETEAEAMKTTSCCLHCDSLEQWPVRILRIIENFFAEAA